jgi:Flp pilus assembly protein protease CpaA
VRFRASDVAAATGGQLVGIDVELVGATFDSRILAPGQLFVPIVADRDGHDFIAAAADAGAGAYLTARPADPRKSPPSAGARSPVLTDPPLPPRHALAPSVPGRGGADDAEADVVGLRAGGARVVGNCRAVERPRPPRPAPHHRVAALARGLVGAAVGYAVPLAIRAYSGLRGRPEPLGLGVVKLLGAIGAYLGWLGALATLFGGTAVGLVVVVVLVGAAARQNEDAAEPLTAPTHLEFGPYLAIAAVGYIVLAPWVRTLLGAP